MKIGEFAKKYGINASAVRYYIDKTLITPKKENGQYIFDKTCVEQMDRIIKYKKYRFSLEDIDLLSHYEGATDLKDKGVIGRILAIFRKKEKQIEKEIEQLKVIHEDLRGEIADYESKAEVEESKRTVYLPIEALDILFCPACNRRLKLKSADIEGRGILKGTLGCSCGYHAVISNGMIVCDGSAEESPFKAFDNVNSVEAVEKDFSPEFRNLIEKAQLWMYQKIMGKGQKFKYALIGPFYHNFILKYLKLLFEDTIYIITDISTEKLKKTQDYIGEADRKLLYIAGDLDKIPIKKESIDLYIDDFSENNYTITYNRNVLDTVGPLMKPKGMLIGQFADYSAAPLSLEKFRKDQEGFDPEMIKPKKMHAAFAEADIKLVEEHNFGFAAGEHQHFATHTAGEKVSVISYSAVKEQIS